MGMPVFLESLTDMGRLGPGSFGGHSNKHSGVWHKRALFIQSTSNTFKQRRTANQWSVSVP